jgi:RNA polymerase sigma-70 factor (ECF subfamily)
VEESDDRGLAAAARSGDRAAFERIVERYAGRVFGIVAGHLGREDAEDAAQEVFIRVYRGLSGFGGESSLSTWIFRIATNVAIARARRLRARPRASPLDEALSPPASGWDPADAAATEERREAVRRAVRLLPEKERAVAVLRGLEGLSFPEVARALGIGRPTAESRMARAKKRLRSMLGRWLS